MTNVSRRTRAGATVAAGRRRADAVATRLGVALRDARRVAGLRQADVARAGGISQSRVGELERGLGSGASIETWALAAAAVGEQLVGFLERAPGATPPRDIEHLRRQAAFIEVATGGGWWPLPELGLDPGAVRSRSVDVALVRLERRQAVLTEIWDWFDDIGGTLRSLDSKRDALATRLQREHGIDWTVRCLFIVRRTRRNEGLVAELRPLFAARFRGSAVDWLAALSKGARDIPEGDGLLWSTAALRLQPSRLGVGRAPRRRARTPRADQVTPTNSSAHEPPDLDGIHTADEPCCG